MKSVRVQIQSITRQSRVIYQEVSHATDLQFTTRQSSQQWSHRSKVLRQTVRQSIQLPTMKWVTPQIHSITTSSCIKRWNFYSPDLPAFFQLWSFSKLFISFTVFLWTLISLWLYEIIIKRHDHRINMSNGIVAVTTTRLIEMWFFTIFADLEMYQCIK